MTYNLIRKMIDVRATSPSSIARICMVSEWPSSVVNWIRRVVSGPGLTRGDAFDD